MIKRFHALYVGQIALDNIGLDGTPANDRRYSNERLSEVFWTARDVAQLMDELGYYCLWTAEHHFQREGYECLPNLIQLGLWLATQTQQLKFGCAFNILPMWHPIRLAEDYPMAASSWGWAAAIIRARWRASARRSSTRKPTASCSRSSSSFCSSASTKMPSITGASTTNVRRRSSIADTA